VIKTRRIRWAGHAAHMGKMRCVRNFCYKPGWKRLLGRFRRRRENTITKSLKRNRMGSWWTGFIWLKIGTSSGLL
jgi:hypothetical protein